MMIQACWRGQVVAESDDTIIIEGNHYFPPQSVNWALLEASDSQTYCPWKGTASYYDLVVDGERNRNAVWTYPDPSPAASSIKGYLAFWHGVQVGPTPAPVPD